MKIDRKLKEDIIKNIIQNDKVVKVILFGSYAYGSPTKDSDLDLIIVEENLESKIKEIKRIRKAIRHIDYAKDIVIADKEEFEFYKNEFGSVYKEANEKGEVLYERAS